jgi:hypothetical protein
VRCDVKRADRRAEDPSKAPSDEVQKSSRTEVKRRYHKTFRTFISSWKWTFSFLSAFPLRCHHSAWCARTPSDAEVRPTSRRANPLLPFHSCPHRPPPPRTPRGSPRAVRRDASPSPFRPALLLAAPVNGCPLTPRPAHDRRGVPRARRREAGRGCPAWTSPSWSPASAAAWR